ncbi:MAG: hypothetical protein Q3962_02695 [Corynebacterium sp.]|nr:hypothetical protein [Corynebacterium sp.]
MKFKKFASSLGTAVILAGTLNIVFPGVSHAEDNPDVTVNGNICSFTVSGDQTRAISNAREKTAEILEKWDTVTSPKPYASYMFKSGHYLLFTPGEPTTKYINKEDELADLGVTVKSRDIDELYNHSSYARKQLEARADKLKLDHGLVATIFAKPLVSTDVLTSTQATTNDVIDKRLDTLTDEVLKDATNSYGVFGVLYLNSWLPGKAQCLRKFGFTGEQISQVLESSRNSAWYDLGFRVSYDAKANTTSISYVDPELDEAVRKLSPLSAMSSLSSFGSSIITSSGSSSK